MATCPNCGSSNVRFELRAAGTKSTTNYYRTGVRNSWLIPAGRKKYSSQRQQKSVGICQNCGYKWDNKEKGCLFYLLCLVFLPITIGVLFYKSKRIKMKKGYRLLIVICALLVIYGGLALIANHSEEGSQSDTDTEVIQIESEWAQEFATLTDFEFYIENDEIHLKKYTGGAKTVCIAPTYEYEGVTMPVVSLDSSFSLKRIETVIVPEGVTQISANCFNSCDIKELFLPQSLYEFSGWSYFHNVEKLYYGGTQEQFQELCPRDRDNLDIIQIIYDAEASELSQIYGE